jgi:rod shape-determining protein MreC
LLNLVKRHRDLLVIAALLVQPLAAFLLRGGRAREPDFLDRWILGLSTPVQRALTAVVEGTFEAWAGYVDLRGVRLRAVGLSAENVRLREQLHQQEELKAENERLRGALQYAARQEGARVAARVVGFNPVVGALSLRIDRGEADGVQPGMAVVTPAGVVGQVLRTGAHAADVLLLGDNSSRVAARNQRSRARATATGAGDGRPLRLEYALRTEDFQEGDVLVTAGTDGIFPPGLLVGTLTAVERKSVGTLQPAEVIPAVDTVRLEEVLVLGAQPAATGPLAGGAP